MEFEIPDNYEPDELFKTVNDLKTDELSEGFDFLILPPSNSDILVINNYHERAGDVSGIIDEISKEFIENVSMSFERDMKFDILSIDEIYEEEEEDDDDEEDDEDDEEDEDEDEENFKKINKYNYLVSSLFNRKDINVITSGLPEAISVNGIHGFYVLKPSIESPVKKFSFFFAKTLSTKIFYGDDQISNEPSNVCLNYLNKRFS